MSENRYKYTQVPSPLVQPGSARGPFSLGKTVVIGEEREEHVSLPDAESPVREGAPAKAGRASKHGSPRKPAMLDQSSERQDSKMKPGKIVLIVIAAIFAVNIAIGMLGCAAELASDVFYDVENLVDEFVFNVLYGI